tara:strand:- start:408 stop:605 length:198 start_codon:yes stop_codon:yes gene_type:complete
MSYIYSVSVEGENCKMSNSWKNLIKYAYQLGKANPGKKIIAKHCKGYMGETWIWSNEDQDIIPLF